MRTLVQIRHEIEELCERGESIIASAEKQNRELTKDEKAELDRIYGQDDHEGKLAALRDEEMRTMKIDEDRKIRAAEKAAEKRLFMDDASMPPSKKNKVVSFSGSSEGRRFRRGESPPSAMLEDMRHIPNAAGEFALAAMLGPNSRTPEPIRAALSTSSNAQGGYLVPDALSSVYVDLARNESQLLNAGASLFQMDAARVLIPTVATDPTVEIKAENAAFTGSDPVFGQLAVEPRTLGILVTISRELAEDGVGVAEILESIMARKIAQMADYYGIQGTGSAQPVGLINNPNIASTSVGGAISWFDIADAITSVRVNNHQPSGIVLSPSNHGDLMKSTTGDGTNAAQNWLLQPPNSEGMGYYPTNNCPDSAIVVGDFSKLLWCVRSGARLETSVTAGEAFERHQLKLKLVIRADWAVTDASAFHILNGIS